MGGCAAASLPLLLAACAVEQSPTYAGYRPPSILTPGGLPLSTAVPPGHGVAILAPLSGPNAERGDALVKAAQLARRRRPARRRSMCATPAARRRARPLRRRRRWRPAPG